MRAEKQLLLDEVKGMIEGAPTFLVTRYRDLSASAMGDFRGTLRRTGGEFEVVRKRILKRAVEALDLSLGDQQLEGHIGVVLAGDDPIATTKAVFEYGKETADSVEVLVGQFEGTFYTSADIEKISKLPTLDGMRAQLLATLMAPASQTLGVIDSLLSSLPHLLQNKSQVNQT